ncbi:TetR/AcrR family transcriptional regulator [Saccharomonospora sp. NPDC046836]|uniref:TetR/AcrR family transcriptional regulator n=1 Tax=Saccharomonospora sp. NPDC046836 TaxID=3156921 RepID=UPI0033CE3931
MGSATEEPGWKQRAVERSTQAAKIRAGQRVERFLDAAQVLMSEKGTTDFTVQEVVDHSRQSLRSFYLHFDGKHELLLALFEDALGHTAQRIRAAASEHTDPLERLEVAVRLLFELSRVSPTAQRPLFTDFAPRLLVSHPAEVKTAHAPLLTALAELLTDAAQAGLLRADVRPRRMAALIMQTVMFNAQSNRRGDNEPTHPLTADEVWTFCAHGFVPEDVALRATGNRAMSAARGQRGDPLRWPQSP